MDIERIMAENREMALKGLDTSLKHIAILRRQCIIEGVPESEVDRYIADMGNSYADKYKNMNRFELMLEMLLHMKEMGRDKNDLMKSMKSNGGNE